MDTGYFCGYIINCVSPNLDMNYGSYDYKELTKLGVDGLPGKSWMYFEGDNNYYFFLCLNKYGIPSNYRCPIHRSEFIGKKGGLKQARKPLDFLKQEQFIKIDPVWEYLITKFGENNVSLGWRSILLEW